MNVMVKNVFHNSFSFLLQVPDFASERKRELQNSEVKSRRKQVDLAGTGSSG
jgi:hypothetical protein